MKDLNRHVMKRGLCIFKFLFKSSPITCKDYQKKIYCWNPNNLYTFYWNPVLIGFSKIIGDKNQLPFLYSFEA